MEPEAAAILWTVVVVYWTGARWLDGMILTVVSFEVICLLSSLPIPFLQEWPTLRPSSFPLCILAVVLLIGKFVQWHRFFRAGSFKGADVRENGIQ